MKRPTPRSCLAKARQAQQRINQELRDRFPQQVEKWWDEHAELVVDMVAEPQLEASDLKYMYYVAFFDALEFFNDAMNDDNLDEKVFAAKMDAAVEECIAFLTPLEQFSSGEM